MIKLLWALVFVVGTGFSGVSLGQSQPAGFFDHPFNGPTKPVTVAGVTTFQVFEGGCSDVEYDSRGESDCSNGSVKSQLGYRPHANLGETRDYSFEFWVDPKFGYEGYHEPDSEPFRAGGWDSNLRIASWEGPEIKSFVYMLKLDARNGATFLGYQCAAPTEFGTWVKFSMKVHWAGDQSGWVKVTCNDRIVYATEGESSTAQIQCYITNECQPGVVRKPKRLQYIVGLSLGGFGDDWADTGHESRFLLLPPEGITIKMRELSVSSDAELYSPEERASVVKLQNALNALGCDVGTADGSVGNRTRQQALTCREFAFGEKPSKLTVATLSTFADLYSRDGVADLPVGKLPTGPGVSVAEVRAEQVGEATSAVSTFEGTVGDQRVFFIFVGEFDYRKDVLTELDIVLHDDIGTVPEALQKCGDYRVEDWGESRHVVLQFRPVGSSYKNYHRDCIVAALPGDLSRQAEFLFDHFDTLAKGMILAGDADRIQHAGVKRFITKVASEKVRVSGN